MTINLRQVGSVLGVAVGLAVLNGASADPADIVTPQVVCEQLGHVVIGPENIGIKSGAARIAEAREASVVAPAGDKKRYCQVIGEIAPLTVGASPIRFEVNLPLVWNSRSLMMGGGGYDGVLIDGLGTIRDAPPGEASPLAQGYVTYGTDSGHSIKGPEDAEPGRFALNDEMFRNFAFESLKKVSDVAAALTHRYYGKPARYRYFVGGSEGGREGLTIAQRYPENFDGIVSVVPVISWTGLFTGFVNYSKPQFEGGNLTEAKIRTIASAVMDSCDGLDGIKDGVVSNYLGCPAHFSIEALRCANGEDRGGTCISDPQLATLKAAYGITELPATMANGTMSYPGRLFGGEIQAGGEGISRWLGDKGVPSNPAKISDGRGVVYGDNFVRFAVTRDPDFSIRDYDPTQYVARLREISELMDSTNTDLSAFYSHGGKLIIRENAGDFAQSPRAGFQYYGGLVKRLGQDRVDKFVRLYVSPGSAHGGAASSFTTGAIVPTSHNLLTDLDRWVVSGEAPADELTQINVAKDAPNKILASRPMCRYPNYPKFIAGNPSEAQSYRCVPSIPSQ